MVVSVADVLLAVAAPDGVPPWLTYLVSGLLGSPFVVAIGWVIVRALAKRLGVQADTAGGTSEGSPATPQGPEQSGQEAPAERYDAKMAMIERAFARQDEQIMQLASQLATVIAERDRIRWLYEQATGRPAPGPPPTPTPSPWPETPRNPPAGPSLGN